MLIFLKIKRIKRYHIKGIGSPLLILINIDEFDQETENINKQINKLSLEPRLITSHYFFKVHDILDQYSSCLLSEI